MLTARCSLIAEQDRIDLLDRVGVRNLLTGLAGPTDLAGYVQGHWGVESLHWLRDTLYREDASTTRTRSGPRIMATLRNLAIGALHLAGRHDITEATRWANRYMTAGGAGGSSGGRSPSVQAIIKRPGCGYAELPMTGRVCGRLCRLSSKVRCGRRRPLITLAPCRGGGRIHRRQPVSDRRRAQ